MTSRELQAKLTDAMHVIASFETALRHKDSLNSELYADEAAKALFDFRDRYPDGDPA